MTTDVLTNHADDIEWAMSSPDSLLGKCILDLAAEVRALREERDAERMAGHIHSKAGDELAQTVYRLRCENDELRERLAAQEPRATLGGMVREGELLK